jgi:hypothetical protein
VDPDGRRRIRETVPVKTATIAAAAALLGLLTACTSSGGGGGSTTPSAPSPSASASVSAPAPSSTAASPTGTPSPSTVTPTATAKGGALTQAQARAALLAPTEVGSGLHVAPVDTTQSPFPCTSKLPPPDVQVPPKASAKSSFTNASKDLQFTEQVESYIDPATAAKALAAGEKGLTCDIGEVHGLGVTIQGPIDLTTSFTTKLDKAEAWALTLSGAKQTIIVAKSGQRIVALTFGATSGADESSEDAAGIAGRALAKAGAAG